MKRPALAEQPALRDGLLATALAAFVELELLASDVEGPTAGLVLLGLGVTLPLAWRRLAPVPVLAIVMVSVLALDAISVEQEPQGTLLPILLAAFSAGAYARRSIALVGVAIAAVGVLLIEPGDFVCWVPSCSEPGSSDASSAPTASRRRDWPS